MKKVLLTLLVALGIAGQAVAQNNVPRGFECFEAKYIYINYKQPIEGYRVKAKVKLPTEGECRCYSLCGSAEIIFQKGGNSYTFYNPYFRIEGLKNGDFYDGDCFNVDYILPPVDYSKPIKLYEAFNNLPFVFFDIDFDGNKELVMVYSNQAQRESDAYEVVATVDADYGDMRFDYDRDIAFCLDGMSEIDFTKKSISLWHSRGIQYSYKTIYFLGKYYRDVVKIVEENYDYTTNAKAGLVGRSVINMQKKKVYTYTPQQQTKKTKRRK